MNSIIVSSAVLLAAAVHHAKALSLSSSPVHPVIVPEVHPHHLTRVSQLVSSALGDANTEGEGSTSANRYASARVAVNDFQSDDKSNDGASKVPQHELVYGELSVPVLAKILDAVGVHEDDVFLDIGSGDGALVLGASLLYASNDNDANEKKSIDGNNAIRKAWGVDIVPGLVDRSKVHADNLQKVVQQKIEQSHDVNNQFLGKSQSDVQFLLGDIHQPSEELECILEETTLAVCFATTWSAGNSNASTNTNKDDDSTTIKQSRTSLQGRKLPKLSKALSTGLSSGCRVVIIDGKLDAADGFTWEGDLRIQCPDTAPYSVASLYKRQ